MLTLETINGYQKYSVIHIKSLPQIKNTQKEKLYITTFTKVWESTCIDEVKLFK